jgi:hypothetical protein
LRPGFNPFALLLMETDKALRVRHPGIREHARKGGRRQPAEQFVF